MKPLLIALLLIAGLEATAQSTSDLIPPDIANQKDIQCSTEGYSFKPKGNDGSTIKLWRARLRATHANGQKWEKKLQGRKTEKEATKDCQLWQEMAAQERRTQQKELP